MHATYLEVAVIENVHAWWFTITINSIWFERDNQSTLTQCDLAMTGNDRSFDLESIRAEQDEELNIDRSKTYTSSSSPFSALHSPHSLSLARCANEARA